MNTFSYLWACELLSWTRQKEEWNRSRGHKVQPPIIVYFLSKVTRHCWSFILHFISKVRPLQESILPVNSSPGYKKKQLTVKPLGTSFNISSIHTSFWHSGLPGESWFIPSAVRQCKGEIRHRHLSSLPGCSQVPWARWNEASQMVEVTDMTPSEVRAHSPLPPRLGPTPIYLHIAIVSTWKITCCWFWLSFISCS